MAQRQPGKLPTLAELHINPADAFKHDELNLLLNQPPHDSWVMKHPLIKVKDAQGQNTALKYLPVDKVEYLLTRIFQQWRREVLREGVMFNSVYAVVRLHYKNPVSGEWQYHDGGGAMPVQTDAGKSAASLEHIKSAAVQMALPAAISYALKDAAENLGKLFGKDLNKHRSLDFVGSYNIADDKQPEVEQKQTPAFANNL